MPSLKIKPLHRKPKLSAVEMRRRAYAAADRICGVQSQHLVIKSTAWQQYHKRENTLQSP